MLSEKTLRSIEYFKIMEQVSSYATINSTKNLLLSELPLTEFSAVKIKLDKTKEAYKILYEFSKGTFPAFDDCKAEIERAKKGGVLNNAELFRIKSLLKTSRMVHNDILSINSTEVIYLKEIASNITIFNELEAEIDFKIISIDKINDNASIELATIRKRIKTINERIKDKLNSYIHGGLGKYLQDNVVTLRENRYVVPVKSEFRGYVKGFIHDQSASGATVFIEPEQIIEYNNELKTALIEEDKEIKRILQDLSAKVKAVSQNLIWNIENLSDIDISYAKAEYAYDTKSIYPILNDTGIIDIYGGRHPLIDKNKVVPIDVSLGKNYNFLLVTGPNTGGKTVTLKLVGLLTAMAMNGLFIPAKVDSKISVFNNIFCDIGDEQSIEQSLSTFSSHMKNIIDILNELDNKSLVLLDELGAGTDPEEGSSLALAIIEELLKSNCYGIITSHFSRLKEFAFTTNKIENASMDFDSLDYRPLYRLIIGLPGSSNAIEISHKLGLSNELTKRATELISDRKISFDSVLKRAEETRHNAEDILAEYRSLRNEADKTVKELEKTRAEMNEERERIKNTAKLEVKRIVNEKIEEAEEIVNKITSILEKEEITTGDLIEARTLRNKLSNSKYISNDMAISDGFSKQIDIDSAKIGDYVYIKKIDSYGYIKSINRIKSEAEISVGNAQVMVKLKDLHFATEPEKPKTNVQIQRHFEGNSVPMELNLLGKNVDEACILIDDYLNSAVLLNYNEVRIIHGYGTGKLREGVKNHLKHNKFVKSMRPGIYGEGENGVTVVTLNI